MAKASLAFLGALSACVMLSGCPDGGGSECSSDADCPGGRYCRASTRTCDFDCTFDADCPSGYLCDPRGRCEMGCAKSNGGVEACDGVDNDCDDLTDEDFIDLGLECNRGDCLGAFVCAADGLATTCTAREPATDDPSCDGLDDDCDGQTDEDALDQLCDLQHGVCAGVTRTCLLTGGWSECDYGGLYSAGPDDGCDQLDNDCDGQTDEDAQNLLLAESGDLATDGLDNNCNGLVDEPGGIMIPLPAAVGGWIDAYEVGVFERADCGGQQYGVAVDDYPLEFPVDATANTVTLYSCSLPDLMPSGYLSWHRAQRVCEAQGKELCTVLGWSQGCNAGHVQVMPYGIIYSPGACNDAWAGSREKTAAGSFPTCTAGNGTFDMTGNMAEWLDLADPDHPDNAFLATIGFSCSLCNRGANCHECVATDQDDEDDFIDADNCLCLQKREQSFPREYAAIDFGARCCLDSP